MFVSFRHLHAAVGSVLENTGTEWGGVVSIKKKNNFLIPRNPILLETQTVHQEMDKFCNVLTLNLIKSTPDFF